MKHRLAIVTSHVIQHQDPRFRRLAEHPAIGLTVLCCSAIGAEWYLDWDLGLEQQWDLEMLHGYRHRCLRSFALRARFARTSGFLLTRTTHGDFCRHFGADPSRFFPMPYAIDNDRFFRASRLRPEERSALRAELGVSADLMVLLFSGKLMVRKRPLIQAYERMINRDSAAVVFMGDGAEPAMLESYVKSRGLPLCQC